MSRILICTLLLLQCGVFSLNPASDSVEYNIDAAPEGRTVPVVVFAPIVSEYPNISQNVLDYLRWCLGTSGIKCAEQETAVSDGCKVSVMITIKVDQGQLKLSLIITDICNIAKYDFEVCPGEWHQVMREVADKIIASVIPRSCAFSAPVVSVVQRADGRQEMIRVYLDGVDTTPLGRSAREIRNVYPMPGGVLYTGLEDCDFVVRKYLDTGVTQDIKTEPKYLMYEFSIRDRVVFTRLSEDGAELGLVENLASLSCIDDRNVKVLHSGVGCAMISPSLSPTSNQVAFVSNDNMLGKYVIQVLGVDSGGVKCIGNFDLDVEAVCWSPHDPGLLAVLVQDGEGHRVCLINSAGDILKSSCVIQGARAIAWQCDGAGVLVCVTPATCKGARRRPGVYVMPIHDMQLHPVCEDGLRYLRLGM